MKPNSTQYEMREKLVGDLTKYKNFGTPFTEDMADHIIDKYINHEVLSVLDRLGGAPGSSVLSDELEAIRKEYS